MLLLLYFIRKPKCIRIFIVTILFAYAPRVMHGLSYKPHNSLESLGDSITSWPKSLLPVSVALYRGGILGSVDLMKDEGS